MKVTWQADDIKAGVAVMRGSIEDTRGLILFQHMQEGPRYCVYVIKTHTVSQPMTKDVLAQYLTSDGFQPAVLLTL